MSSEQIEFLDQILYVQRRSERLALIQGDRTISFRELASLMGAACESLQRAGVKRGDRVVLSIPKSIESIALLYGILRAGAAYVALDERLPAERAVGLIRRIEARIVVTDAAGAAKLAPSHLGGTTILDVGNVLTGASGEPGPRVPGGDPSDLAYVVFTSGSTGRPKGVMISHANVLAFRRSYQELIDFNSETRFYNIAPLYFDASVSGLFCVLGAGGSLVLGQPFRYPAELVRDIAASGATAAGLISSIVRTVASPLGQLDNVDLSRLRLLSYGGEVCPVDVLRRMKARIPQLRFLHGYGPTEVTHSSTAMVFDDLPEGVDVMPIGRALANVSAFVLDEAGSSVPVGGSGELYLGGPQVMRGYWGEPERTAAVLAPPPASLQTNLPALYRTGDFVRVLNDGVFAFEGRRDDLVKVGGTLVSTIEVEHALRSHADVIDAIVLTRSDTLGITRLHAVVVPRHGELDILQVEGHIRQTLPAAMIPSKYRMIADGELPRTVNGKVDKRALLNALEGES